MSKMYTREADFQRDAKDLLDLILKPPCFHLHLPNEGKRSKWHGGELKRQGLLPGAADHLVFTPGGRTICFELKSKSGTQTDAQKDFQALCEVAGMPYFLVRTLDEIEAALVACAVPLRIRRGL